MSVSLTSSGLYLEPRAYTSSDGVNYGTPKFVSRATSLGGGSWSGLCLTQSSASLSSSFNYHYTRTDWSVESNVSSSSGGGIYFRVS